MLRVAAAEGATFAVDLLGLCADGTAAQVVGTFLGSLLSELPGASQEELAPLVGCTGMESSPVRL